MSYRLTENINFLKVIMRYIQVLIYRRKYDIPSRYHAIPDDEYQGAYA